MNGNGTVALNNEFLGIPGTTETKDGYDTSLGNASICWTGSGYNQSEPLNQSEVVESLVRTVFPNPLVENFTLIGKTNILEECPKDNMVSVEKPLESLRGERLRTLRYYNYSLDLRLDLDTLKGKSLVTDNGTSTIALQVIVCSLGKSGFCSPFVHEQGKLVGGTDLHFRLIHHYYVGLWYLNFLAAGYLSSLMLSANAREAIKEYDSGQKLVETKKKVTGNLHGGTHIHSPWVFLNLGKNRTVHWNVTIPMLVNVPGEYFVIGTVQMYTNGGSNNTSGTIYRWDMANALAPGEGRYVHYQDPARINQVSKGVRIFSYVAIGVGGAMIVFFLFQLLVHRNHQVLQLSQVDSLVVFTVSSLVATIACFLMVPENDIYCQMTFPMLLIPIQLMYAVTVARLWRIHAVISPLLLEHLTKGRPDMTQRFVQAITQLSFVLHNLFSRKKDARRSTVGSIKQQISKAQLTLVIALFALPQIIIQIIALILQPQKRDVDFNSDESIGRATCHSHANTAHEVVIYGFLALILLIILLLFMAHSSRKLPSLFNETHVIYDSTFLSMVLLVLGGAVIALTNGPNISPDVEYLVKLVLVLSITLNSTVRILLPKLKKVWKNETVVVSKLVTDHHRKAREKEASKKDSSMQRVSGLDNPNLPRPSGSGYEDYDRSQTRGFLTYHSDSNDIGGRSTLYSSTGRDSAASYEEHDSAQSQLNISQKSLSDTQRGSHNAISHGDIQHGVDKKGDPMLVIAEESSDPQKSEMTKELDGHRIASSTELDMVPGDSASDQCDGPVANPPPNIASGAEIGAFSEKKAASVLADQSDAGTAEAKSSGNELKSKNVSFFERRTDGFMKQALSKRMSWNVLGGSSTEMSGSQRFTPSQPSKTGEAPEKDKNRGASKRKNKHLSRRIIVTENETPARRLVLKMLDLHDQLEALNNKIMSGLTATEEDWNVVTKLTSRLDRTFTDEVEFEWDLARKYEEQLQHAMPADMGGSTRDFSQNLRMDISDCGKDLEMGEAEMGKPKRDTPSTGNDKTKALETSSGEESVGNDSEFSDEELQFL